MVVFGCLVDWILDTDFVSRSDFLPLILPHFLLKVRLIRFYLTLWPEEKEKKKKSMWGDCENLSVNYFNIQMTNSTVLLQPFTRVCTVQHLKPPPFFFLSLRRSCQALNFCRRHASDTVKYAKTNSPLLCLSSWLLILCLTLRRYIIMNIGSLLFLFSCTFRYLLFQLQHWSLVRVNESMCWIHLGVKR